MRVRWGAFLIIVFVAFILWLIGSSESFQHCIQTQKHHQAYQALYEKSPLFIKAIVRLYVRLILHGTCARVTASENDGAIAALATIIVALFAFTLWRATDRLWQSAENQLDAFRGSLEQERRLANEQSVKMEASIAEAARAAAAMERFASAAAQSAAAARDSANALPALERAYLFVEVQKSAFVNSMKAYFRLGGIEPLDPFPQNPWVDYQLVNYGKTPAIVKKMTVMLAFVDEGLPEQISVSAADLPDTVVVRADSIYPEPTTHEFMGQDYPRTHRLSRRLGRKLTDEEILSLKDKAGFLHFFGIVIYEDIFGLMRETTFLWRYTAEGEGRFEEHGGEKYNRRT